MQIFHFLSHRYFINTISLHFQVMPPLNKHFKPLDEGWSKQQPDDLMEKTFTATFPAFKFPDRERLHVSCGVQLCKGKCPNVSRDLDFKNKIKKKIFASGAFTKKKQQQVIILSSAHYNI